MVTHPDSQNVCRRSIAAHRFSDRCVSKAKATRQVANHRRKELGARRGGGAFNDALQRVLGDAAFGDIRREDA